MSPSRSRNQFIAARPRSEVFSAIAVSAGVVLSTVALIWLLRPGPRGVPGKGGLLSRQPRMTILLIVAAIAIASWAIYVLRRRQAPRFGRWGAIAVGSGVVVAVAVIAGIFWPGGVIRHWPSLSPVIETPASVPSNSPANTAPGNTTRTGATVKTPPTAASPTTKGR